MSQWFQYMHIERLDSQEVEGLLSMPEIWIEPKLDGCNVSLFLDDGGILQVAKRSQVLGEGHDLRGVKIYVANHMDRYLNFFNKYPNTILYGEMLVKHTVSWYRESAWNQVYIFDILDLRFDRFVKPSRRVEMLREFDITQIEPLVKLEGPLLNDSTVLQDILKSNRFLIDEPDRIGEGIVIKAFSGDQPYRNQYGRTTWGKIVTEAFKEKQKRPPRYLQIKEPAEHENFFAETFITIGRVEKCKQKIMDDKGTGWDSRYIGDLLRRVYADALQEELLGFIREEKVEALNFKTLGTACVMRAKKLLGL